MVSRQSVTSRRNSMLMRRLIKQTVDSTKPIRCLTKKKIVSKTYDQTNQFLSKLISPSLVGSNIGKKFHVYILIDLRYFNIDFFVLFIYSNNKKYVLSSECNWLVKMNLLILYLFFASEILQLR